MASEPGCPIEMHRIKIAKCDEMFDRDCRGGRTMPFHRAMYDTRTGQSPNNPREQVRGKTNDQRYFNIILTNSTHFVKTANILEMETFNLNFKSMHFQNFDLIFNIRFLSML